MEQESELQRLEQFVENLLVRFTGLREENRKLQGELVERDKEIQNLRSNLSSSDIERNEISLRVNRLVAQIEEWERNLGEDVVTEQEPSGEDEDFTPEERTGEESGVVPHETGENSSVAEDEEGRVQHNLFSMGTSSSEE
ncbi:hypothetical protein [Desulfomarina sp.]